MIDTHCHLIDPQFQNDLNEVCNRAYSIGIKFIINVGYDLKTSLMAIRMSEKFPKLLPSVGIHPNENADESISDMADIEKISQEKNVIAIGETGLDYYRDFSPKDAQRELFLCHIRIAKRHNLPLIIHTRNSIDDAIRILKQEGYYKGVFHCYSGTVEYAKKIIDLGFYLGFGGTLTFSKKVRELFKMLPLEKIVLETDAPFLAPEGYRGRRNEPAYLLNILHTAAVIREIPQEKMEEITDRNAHKLFHLGNE